MWSEKGYALLPISLQNVAMSMKGFQLHRQRYCNASFQEMADGLQRNERMTWDDLRQLQFKMFREFAAHCYTQSPYYRKLWQSHQLRPEDVQTPQDMRLIPVVPKQEMRKHTREFLTKPVGRTMTAVHTSGTTGSPLTVYFSAEDIARRYAFLERCRRWAGVRIGQKRASFTGRNLVPQKQDGPPFWRHNYAGKQLLFSSYHLSPNHLCDYVEALNRFQPEIIDGYPSAIHVAAEYILRTGAALSFTPRAILVSAETVLPHQRQDIERAFGAKLYNQYASSEGAPFISECAYGSLHVHPDSGVIEILDANGDPAPPGEVGQMVVTSFTTHVVPMLRLEMGDAAVPALPSAPCACGLRFPIVDAIVGRVDDVLYTPDRGFVGRMDTVFKGIPSSIAQAQIVQVSPQTIILRIVPDRASYQIEHADRVVKEMRRKLGDLVTLRVEEVESIPRSANGKLRAVINLCTELLPSTFSRNKEVGGTMIPADENVSCRLL